MIRHDPTRRRYDPAYGPFSGITSPDKGSCSMLSKAWVIRRRSRAGTRTRARSARLLRTTFQVMQHGAQRPSVAASELRFGLAQGVDLVRQRLCRGWQAAHRAHIPTYRLPQRLRPGQALVLADPIELRELLLRQRGRDRFFPHMCRHELIPDLLHTLYHSCSFDDLVGAGEDRGRDREAECLSRLEIDDQLEGRRLLDRQVGGLRARAELVDGVAARGKGSRSA